MALDPISNVAEAAAKIIGLFKASPDVKLADTFKLQESQLQGQIQEVLARIQADSVAQASVNATMQAETKAPWFDRDWRAMWGYLSGFAFFFQVAAVIYVMCWRADKAPQVVQLVTSLTPFWGVPLSILGITAWHKGRADQITAGK